MTKSIVIILISDYSQIESNLDFQLCFVYNKQMIQEAREIFMRMTMSERDLPVGLAKLDISYAIARGHIRRNDIDFLNELYEGRDPTNSGLNNQQIIDLTRSKATEIFGQRAGLVFGWGYAEVWNHMSSEYRKHESVNKPQI